MFRNHTLITKFHISEIIRLKPSIPYTHALQRQKAVFANLWSKKMLLFGFARQYNILYHITSIEHIPSKFGAPLFTAGALG